MLSYWAAFSATGARMLSAASVATSSMVEMPGTKRMGFPISVARPMASSTAWMAGMGRT